MDLSKYSLEDCLVSALKSEIDSKKIYSNLADKINNYLIKDKLIFLAEEEEKHRQFIEDIYLNHFPDKEIKYPERTPIPLPEVNVSEDSPLSKILRSAMDAEKSAHDFYKSFAGKFPNGSKINQTLSYFADMETGHYKILETEVGSIERFEEADVYWEMVHVGP